MRNRKGGASRRLVQCGFNSRERRRRRRLKCDRHTHARTHAHLLPSMSYTHNTHRVGDWSECRECEGTLNFRKNTWRAGGQPGEQTRDWAAKQEILRVLSFIKRRSPGRERGREGGRSQSSKIPELSYTGWRKNRSNANANEQISCMHAVMHNQRMHC